MEDFCICVYEGLLVYSFLTVSWSGFAVRVTVASENELGSTFSSVFQEGVV